MAPKNMKIAIVALALALLIFFLYPRFDGSSNKYEDSD